MHKYIYPGKLPGYLEKSSQSKNNHMHERWSRGVNWERQKWSQCLNSRLKALYILKPFLAPTRRKRIFLRIELKRLNTGLETIRGKRVRRLWLLFVSDTTPHQWSRLIKGVKQKEIAKQLIRKGVNFILYTRCCYLVSDNLLHLKLDHETWH